VRGRDGQIKARRGVRRRLKAEGGVAVEEVNPETRRWRLRKAVLAEPIGVTEQKKNK